MEKHEALQVFIGDWYAEGTVYGGPEQTSENPHAGATPWRSTHSARWHTGGYFVVQDERANGPFDTLSFLGWDLDAERYFVRSVENHGFSRDYTLEVNGETWTITGSEERAVHEFADEGRTQTISWQRRVVDAWLPLCDRVARRVN